MPLEFNIFLTMLIFYSDCAASVDQVKRSGFTLKSGEVVTVLNLTFIPFTICEISVIWS